MQGEHASSLEGVARPFHTFDDQDLFPDPFDKIAALFHGISCDHPFADGNKRTAAVCTVAFLTGQGVAGIEPPTDRQVRMLGDLALATASGQVTVDKASGWLRRIFDPALMRSP